MKGKKREEKRNKAKKASKEKKKTRKARKDKTRKARKEEKKGIIGQLREFEPRRVHTRINLLGLFLQVHKSICGKRESVSLKNRRAVGDKNSRQEPGGRRDDTCDHGLSRSWKIEV